MKYKSEKSAHGGGYVKKHTGNQRSCLHPTVNDTILWVSLDTFSLIQTENVSPANIHFDAFLFCSFRLASQWHFCLLITEAKCFREDTQFITRVCRLPATSSSTARSCRCIMVMSACGGQCWLSVLLTACLSLNNNLFNSFNAKHRWQTAILKTVFIRQQRPDRWEVPRSVSAAITSVSADLGLSLICVLRLKKKNGGFLCRNWVITVIN